MNYPPQRQLSSQQQPMLQPHLHIIPHPPPPHPTTAVGRAVGVATTTASAIGVGSGNRRESGLMRSSSTGSGTTVISSGGAPGLVALHPPITAISAPSSHTSTPTPAGNTTVVDSKLNSNAVLNINLKPMPRMTTASIPSRKASDLMINSDEKTEELLQPYGNSGGGIGIGKPPIKITDLTASRPINGVNTNSNTQPMAAPGLTIHLQPPAPTQSSQPTLRLSKKTEAPSKQLQQQSSTAVQTSAVGSIAPMKRTLSNSSTNTASSVSSTNRRPTSAAAVIAANAAADKHRQQRSRNSTPQQKHQSARTCAVNFANIYYTKLSSNPTQLNRFYATDAQIDRLEYKQHMDWKREPLSVQAIMEKISSIGKVAQVNIQMIDYQYSMDESILFTVYGDMRMASAAVAATPPQQQSQQPSDDKNDDSSSTTSSSSSSSTRQFVQVFYIKKSGNFWMVQNDMLRFISPATATNATAVNATATSVMEGETAPSVENVTVTPADAPATTAVVSSSVSISGVNLIPPTSTSTAVTSSGKISLPGSGHSSRRGTPSLKQQQQSKSRPSSVGSTHSRPPSRSSSARPTGVIVTAQHVKNKASSNVIMTGPPPGVGMPLVPLQGGDTTAVVRVAKGFPPMGPPSASSSASAPSIPAVLGTVPPSSSSDLLPISSSPSEAGGTNDNSTTPPIARKKRMVNAPSAAGVAVSRTQQLLQSTQMQKKLENISTQRPVSAGDRSGARHSSYQRSHNYENGSMARPDHVDRKQYQPREQQLMRDGTPNQSSSSIHVTIPPKSYSTVVATGSGRTSPVLNATQHQMTPGAHSNSSPPLQQDISIMTSGVTQPTVIPTSNARPRSGKGKSSSAMTDPITSSADNSYMGKYGGPSSKRSKMSRDRDSLTPPSQQQQQPPQQPPARISNGHSRRQHSPSDRNHSRDRPYYGGGGPSQRERYSGGDRRPYMGSGEQREYSKRNRYSNEFGIFLKHIPPAVSESDLKSILLSYLPNSNSDNSKKSKPLSSSADDDSGTANDNNSVTTDNNNAPPPFRILQIDIIRSKAIAFAYFDNKYGLEAALRLKSFKCFNDHIYIEKKKSYGPRPSYYHRNEQQHSSQYPPNYGGYSGGGGGGGGGGHHHGNSGGGGAPPSVNSHASSQHHDMEQQQQQQHSSSQQSHQSHPSQQQHSNRGGGGGGGGYYPPPYMQHPQSRPNTQQM